MSRLLFVSIFLLFFSLFAPISVVSSTYAQESTSTAKIMEVSGVASTRERLMEKISSFFKFSQKDKINYQQELTEKRLAELKYVTDNDRGDMIEEISSRYSTYLGNLTEIVIKNKAMDKKQELLEMYDNHSKILENLIQEFEANSGLWLLFKHDINYVKIYSDQIKAL